jgi:PAS domain S-box-containing protein
MTHRSKVERQTSVVDRLALLEQVGRELTAGLDLMGILRRALALSVQALDADCGILLLLDEQRRLAVGGYLYGGKFRQVDVGQARIALKEGLPGWVVEHREAARIDDVKSDPRWLSTPLAECGDGVCSVISIPLLIPRRVVGVLTCTHPQGDFFTQEDVDTLWFIADQAAVALENARLFAVEEERRHFAEVLGEIARTLTATLDLDEVLTLILEQLGRVVPYDGASIFLLHEQQLVVHAWQGFANASVMENLSFQMEKSQVMERVVSAREAIVYADVQEEAGWKPVEGLPLTHGWIGAPLAARGEVVGVLTVDSQEVGTYGEEDARVVAAFADYAAIAVANARLLKQLQRRLDEAAFLYQTSRALTTSLDLEEVLYSLMSEVREHFEIEAASVALVDEETQDVVFRVAVGSASDRIVGQRLKLGQGVAGWVAESGQPALVPNAPEDPRFYAGLDELTGFQTETLIAVPIRLEEQTIGVVEAINPIHAPLNENDLRLLLSVGALAASAIQNARHYTRARDAEQRYASLFNSSADPILITDASGQITDVNRTMCEMLHYEEEELVGRDIFSLHKDSVETREQLAQALQGEGIFYRVEAFTREGATVPFEVRATRIVHGDQPYIQWICHDISERLELEQAREDLTHMIIHDLRNPLSSVMSSLELIQSIVVDGATDLPMDQVFTVARRSGEKLYLLIDSLLDLARLEKGQTGLKYQQTDVKSLMFEVTQQIQPLVAAYELDLQSDLPDSLPYIWSDQELLQRVLLNLLDNAVKFTPSGGEIRIAVSQSDEESLLFLVADTGPGIAPEHHELIFERFARATDEGRGTGLGLALCKLAVEAHGGRIWVDSQPGEGATFQFILPIKGEEVEE